MAFNVTSADGFQVDENTQGSVATNLISGSGIALDSNLEITFSEDVASNSVLSFAVTLFRTLPDGGSQVPVDVTLSQPETNKIVINPTDNFIAQASYALYIPKSKHGIRNSAGDPLEKSFNCSFNAGGLTDYINPDQSNNVSTDTDSSDTDADVDVPVVGPEPEELFLVGSSPADESILQYGYGMINAKFDGKLPEEITVVKVTPRHPLGFAGGLNSLWSDNSTKDNPLVSVDGTELTVKSEILEADIEDTSLLVDVTSNAITAANQIPYVGSSVNEDGDTVYTLDFDVNKIFDVEFDIPGNTENPMMSFMGLLYPFYATLEEVKVDIGPFVNQYDDFTLTLSIFRHSITARQIWSDKNSMPVDSVPIRLTEYVMARTKRDILHTYFTDPTTVGSGSFALGDLRMSGRNYLDYLKEIIATLDMKIVALENALKRGDNSTSPYTDFGHKALPTSSTSVSAGSANGNDWDSKGLGRGFSSKVKNG